MIELVYILILFFVCLILGLSVDVPADEENQDNGLSLGNMDDEENDDGERARANLN